MIAGAVLCGGRSLRMGRDKASVPVDGVPMADRVAAALHDAGCTPVVAIGGHPAAHEITVVADDHPGEGPLGGILTALRHWGGPVAVAGCDMPWLSGDVVRALIDALGSHDVAAARGDRLEPLCAVWSVASARHLVAEFERGERAVRRAMASLDVVEVGVDPAAVRNVNSPADLA